MTDKRFLFSVIALVSFGLPAGAASVVTYCNGGTGSPGCMDSAGSFDSSGLLAIVFTGGSIVSNSFTDSGSGTIFYDDANFSNSLVSISGDTIVDSKGGFQINLPANTLVFSLEYLVASGDTFNVSFVSGGSNYNAAFTSSGAAIFFAATSDQAITDLTVVGSSNAAGTISNFELQGTGSDTPEVGTLLLIGFGLIAMRYLRRAQLLLFHSPRTA